MIPKNGTYIVNSLIGIKLMKPLAIDLYCGLGGWADGFLAEGYDVIGFDIERHDYGTAGYPGQLVLQDVLTLHGSQFKDAAVIVASPPCQAYSYRAMPWKRAKALPSPSNELFDACFRIQCEACEAAGHHIPLIVENVKGAQPWVGRTKWHYGSYYLWGDVPALMPFASGSSTKLPAGNTTSPLWAERPIKRLCDAIKVGDGNRFRATGEPSPHFTNQAEHRKNDGGSWFAVAHNTESGHSRNPVTGEGVKRPGINLERDGMNNYPKGSDGLRVIPGGAKFAKRQDARKAASAMIAKIPFPLARYIARVFNVQGS